MPAIDTFSGSGRAIDSPAWGGEVVVPHDVNEQNIISRGIYVGGAGNVSALMMDGSTLLFTALPVGIHPMRCRRINATSTTATNLLFLV